jgi:DNA processing protein
MSDPARYSESDLLLWLRIYSPLTFKRLREVIEVYGDLETAFSDRFAKVKADWAPRNFKNLESDLRIIRDRCLEEGISWVTMFDSTYPDAFRNLPQQPVVLFYQGDWSVLNRNMMITVVGSRNYDVYAEQMVTQLLRDSVHSGMIVASGLAYGVDSLAHRVAVDLHKPTIGIIGSGLDTVNFYPQQHLALKKQMIDYGGLVISEYPPGTEPRTFHFPARNRLLAALSRVTLVVQAHYKSGSLITAKEALEQGKTVATIPARITDKGYSGNIELLKQGAQLVSSSEELAGLLGLEQHESVVIAPEFDTEIEREVFSQLSVDPLAFDTLAERIERDPTELSTTLSLMELQGFTRNVGENKWIALI